jgi:hypothetical protein
MHGRIDDRPARLNDSAGSKVSGLQAALPHDMENGLPAADKIISDYAAVASPPDGFRTHDCAAPFMPFIEEDLEASTKLRRERIIGIVMKALVRPEAVDILRRGLRLPAKTTECCHVLIGDVEGRQSVGKCILVELRIGSRPGNRSDVREKLDVGFSQQLDELLEASVGMADREEGKLHTSPSLRCVFERAALVGRDMIGFVAFDFVLRIVFRSVMDMTFVIKVRGMDGDDGPCHTASFGIPAYMIAYLESPIHLSDSLLLPAAPHLGPLCHHEELRFVSFLV